MLAMASNDKDAVANDRTGTPLSWNSHAWSCNDSVVAGINNIYRRQIAMVVIATHYNDVPVLTTTAPHPHRSSDSRHGNVVKLLAHVLLDVEDDPSKSFTSILSIQFNEP